MAAHPSMPELPLGGRPPLTLPADVGVADVGWLCTAVEIAASAGDEPTLDCNAGATSDPDLGALECLARMSLTARRNGRRLRLRQTHPDLRGLLAFAGLWGLLACEPEDDGAGDPKAGAGQLASPPGAAATRRAGRSGQCPGRT